MSVLNTISPDKLVRLVGIPTGPVLIDVRPEEEFSAEPLLIPLPSIGAQRIVAVPANSRDHLAHDHRDILVGFAPRFHQCVKIQFEIRGVRKKSSNHASHFHLLGAEFGEATRSSFRRLPHSLDRDQQHGIAPAFGQQHQRQEDP